MLNDNQKYERPPKPDHEVLYRGPVGLRRAKNGPRRTTQLTLTEVRFNDGEVVLMLSLGEYQARIYPDVARLLGAELYDAGTKEGN